MYDTEIGYLASTSRNISGIYDMSGGAHEYMSVYTLDNSDNSGITFTNYGSKYYDVYNESSMTTSYQCRILGDATEKWGHLQL